MKDMAHNTLLHYCLPITLIYPEYLANIPNQEGNNLNQGFPLLRLLVNDWPLLICHTSEQNVVCINNFYCTFDTFDISATYYVTFHLSINWEDIDKYTITNKQNPTKTKYNKQTQIEKNSTKKRSFIQWAK
jgi:hypothetical protein